MIGYEKSVVTELGYFQTEFSELNYKKKDKMLDNEKYVLTYKVEELK